MEDLRTQLEKISSGDIKNLKVVYQPFNSISQQAMLDMYAHAVQVASENDLPFGRIRLSFNSGYPYNPSPGTPLTPGRASGVYFQSLHLRVLFDGKEWSVKQMPREFENVATITFTSPNGDCFFALDEEPEIEGYPIVDDYKNLPGKSAGSTDFKELPRWCLATSSLDGDRLKLFGPKIRRGGVWAVLALRDIRGARSAARIVDIVMEATYNRIMSSEERNQIISMAETRIRLLAKSYPMEIKLEDIDPLFERIRGDRINWRVAT
jgi:hypothetical protein